MTHPFTARPGDDGAPASFQAFEALKVRVADEIACFLGDHPGCDVKVAMELIQPTAHGDQKLKVTLANIPAKQPQLPGFDTIDFRQN